ncbi:MAG TPA: TlpA disulfide reductase family protein [Pyrinomonadaceae bacterium]|nr:TlpA disulfide reductase family protein [Pyrinomonadaceae bacterium]
MAVKKKDRTATPIKFWTPLRIVTTLIVMALLAAIGVSSCNSNDSSSRTAHLPVVPSVVFDTEMTAANGSPIKLSNYSGKILFVNLWATWCGPCRMETPELVRLHKEYEARGVEFIGLSTEDPNTSAEKVRDFVQQYNVDYHVGWATREVALTLMQGKTTIPQSFIITRDGRLFKKIDGFHPVRTPPELRKALDAALAG